MKKLSDKETRHILEARLNRSLSRIDQKYNPDEKDIDEKHQLEIDKLKEENNNLRHNRNLREEYAKKSWWFLCGYTGVSFSIIVLDGFSFWGFDLNWPVLSVIAGSTAISAIGLIMQVNRGLFGHGGG